MQIPQKSTLDPLTTIDWYIDIAVHLIGEAAAADHACRRIDLARRLSELHERIYQLFERADSLDLRTVRIRHKLGELETAFRAHNIHR